MQHHIFLSYSRTDSEMMRRIRDDFRSAGLTIWTDEGIEPGTPSWKLAIEEAILSAGCLVVILSPDATNSRWVRAEIDFAELQSKPVFLVLARGEEKESIPFGFATFQWVDLRDAERYTAGVMRLVSSINQRLSNQTISHPSKHPDTLTLLPKPFEWCSVSPGTVMLSDASHYTPAGTGGGKYEIGPFKIAKYPITNLQFQTFIDHKEGYSNPQWWDFSETARHWRVKNQEPQPTTFPGNDRPRTNVTWYESIAFCIWLSTYTGETISLPTEQQWQRAAQGDTYRKYPWGNEFDAARCSADRKGTSPVTLYSSGVSPFGVMHMSGNVWEWCLNTWSIETIDVAESGLRLLRGGSYYDDPSLLTVTHRSGGYPQDRNFFRGFRIVKLG